MKSFEAVCPHGTAESVQPDEKAIFAVQFWPER